MDKHDKICSQIIDAIQIRITEHLEEAFDWMVELQRLQFDKSFPNPMVRYPAPLPVVDRAKGNSPGG